MRRLDDGGDRIWAGRAPGKRETWSRQREETRDLRREADRLRGGVARAGAVPDRNTAIFGGRGKVADTGVRGGGRAKHSRRLETAREQIDCSLEIAGAAFAELARGDGADLDEVAYLADEAVLALNGATRGLACSRVAPSGAGGRNLDGVRTELAGILADVIREVETVGKAESAIATLRMAEEMGKERAGQAKEARKEGKETEGKTGHGTSPAAGDDAVARALAEQRAFQAREREKAEEIFGEQKENENALAEALALLRESQRNLNEQNARKDAGFSRLDALGSRAEELRRKLQEGGVP